MQTTTLKMKANKGYLLLAALLFFTVNIKADGLFGAGWKPKPNVTLFGQKITWPIPSICIGAKAGVLPDAGLSSDGVNLKIPYLAVDIPFPSLTLKSGEKVVKLKVGAIEKSTQEKEK